MDDLKFREEDYNNPKFWKWGVFYFNKDDKRIFPPKRNEFLGWTVNFANPKSIFAMIAITALILIITSFIFN